MVNFPSTLPVYLATGATDIRKSIDGLAALVQASMGLDPFSPALFVFCNRKRDKLKILHFERNGFWLTEGSRRACSAGLLSKAPSRYV